VLGRRCCCGEPIEQGEVAVKTTNWAAWEYRVLAEGHPPEKAARLLGRPQEVVEAKTRGECEATLAGWYARRRPPHAPRSAEGLIRLATKLMQQDFPRLLEGDGVLSHLWQVLDHAFRRFDPRAGDPDVPVADRFLLAFRVWLRQRLRRASRRLQGARARRPRLRPPKVLEHEVPDPVSERAAGAWGHEGWHELLFRQALTRLDSRTRRCLELRAQGEMPTSIARRLGISAKTAANRYSASQLVGAARRVVRGLVLGLPAADRLRLVAHLAGPAGLTDAAVVGLLCLPDTVIGPLLEQVRAGGVDGIGHEEAVALVSRPADRAA
jgi:hypothetical protein